MGAAGPPCVVCEKRVPRRAVTRCPWCGRVLCLVCNCPGRCADIVRIRRRFEKAHAAMRDLDAILAAAKEG